MLSSAQILSVLCTRYAFHSLGAYSFLRLIWDRPYVIVLTELVHETQNRLMIGLASHFPTAILCEIYNWAACGLTLFILCETSLKFWDWSLWVWLGLYVEDSDTFQHIKVGFGLGLTIESRREKMEKRGRLWKGKAFEKWFHITS